MVAFAIFVLWSYVVVQGNRIELKPDPPSLRVQISKTAVLQCCHSTGGVEPHYTWIRRLTTRNRIMNSVMNSTVNVLTKSDPRVTIRRGEAKAGVWCPTLELSHVQLNDSGLYHCFLNHSTLKTHVYSHGTYLQVYKPMERILNTSESTKNKILTAQGILLLLCLFLHGVPLLLKSKKLNELHEKKMKKEEENIYEGLNLEDCCTAYDQIQRSQLPNPYQDVGNVMEEEEEIQLEKP